MPIKEITINNNRYKIVCKEGQEQHLTVLADKLNDRIDSLKKDFNGKCSELTLMVLIALDLEDQLLESKNKYDNTFEHIMERIQKIMMKIEEMQCVYTE